MHEAAGAQVEVGNIEPVWQRKQNRTATQMKAGAGGLGRFALCVGLSVKQSCEVIVWRGLASKGGPTRRQQRVRFSQ